VVGKLLTLRHGRVEFLERLDALRFHPREFEARFLRLVELSAPGLMEAFPQLLIGKSQANHVTAGKKQRRTAPETALTQGHIALVGLAGRGMQ